jgi:hypothetical protein
VIPFRPVPLVTFALAGLTGLLVLVVPSPGEESPPALEYTLSTPKADFALGEPVTVTFTWRNTGREPLRFEGWRGPQSGVTEGGAGLDFQVVRTDAAGEHPLPYQGCYACGGVELLFPLDPGQSRSESYVINSLGNSAYSMDEPGIYAMRSVYYGAILGAADAPGKPRVPVCIRAPVIRINMARLCGEALGANRGRIHPGDLDAVSIAVAHRDALAVPAIRALTSQADVQVRHIACIALALIGGDEAVDAMGRAAKSETEGWLRSEYARALGESANARAIPHLRRLLGDPEYTLFHHLGDGRWFKTYHVRCQALLSLRALGVTVDVPWEVEVTRDGWPVIPPAQPAIPGASSSR